MNRIFKLSAYLIDTDGLDPFICNKGGTPSVGEQFVDWASTLGFRKVNHLHLQCADLDDSEAPKLLERNCDLSFCEKHFQKQTSATEYDRPIPHPGEYWKHFKVGKIVRIIAVSRCTESPDSFSVIYQTPGGTVWDRPLDMFMSEVDHEKYPQSKEKYRFSKVEG
jgi:hypothetical protein